MGNANKQPSARYRFIITNDRKGLTKVLPWFLIPFAIFLLRAGLALYSSNDLKDLHLSFQQFHDPISDLVFSQITFLGDGIFVVIVGLALALFYQFRAGLFLLTASLIDSIVVQYLKRQVFPDHFRPMHYLADHPDWVEVAGVELHEKFSFPSGHTAAAFCLYFALTLIFRRSYLALLFFILALAVGWSRIHLNQHFLEDIYLGSLIGTALAAITFPLFYKRNPVQLNRVLDRPLIRFK